jgi:tetratricopeptide (TPR) repeat protein
LLDTVTQHGADASLWIAIAESYAADEEIEQKRDAYRQALGVEAENEEALLGVAQTSARLLEFEEAAEQLETLHRRRPRRFGWMLSTGDRGTPGLIELYWIVGDYEAASDLVRRAESTEGIDDTWKRRFRLAGVETLRLSGRRDEALARLKQWAEEFPDDRAWNATLALEYQRQGHGAEAVPIWEGLRRANPNDRDALRELVRALMDAKRYGRAEQYILEWLDDDPENDLAIRWLVTVLGGAERCDDGLELARSRLLHTLAREELQDQIVTLLSGEKRFTECLDFIEGLFDETTDLIRALLEGREGKEEEGPSRDRVVRRPNEPFSMERLQARVFELRLMRAAVLIESREFRTAEEELQSWLETAGTPDERFQYLIRLAESRRRGGNEQEANDVLARALTLRPSDSMMNNNVAYAWIDKGVRLDAGERMIRFAMSREPRQPAFLDTFGWLLYKKGEFGEAVKWLLRARAGRPDDPVIHDHLGDAYWRLGRSEEAIGHWEAAVVAAAKVSPERLENNADERRVRETGPQKIEDAREGREPAVAPVAGP